MVAYENDLSLIEAAVKEGMLTYEQDPLAYATAEAEALLGVSPEEEALSSDGAVKRCKRPYWVCQSRVRPLPKETIKKGSVQLSKKEQTKLAKEVGLPPKGAIDEVKVVNGEERKANDAGEKVEVPKEGMVCG